MTVGDCCFGGQTALSGGSFAPLLAGWRGKDATAADIYHPMPQTKNTAILLLAVLLCYATASITLGLPPPAGNGFGPKGGRKL